MSKKLEEVLELLDVGNQTPASGGFMGLIAGSKDTCWRCMNKADRGPDRACEACFAWMTMESDVDPRRMFDLVTGHGA
jgi:hypothetical protein